MGRYLIKGVNDFETWCKENSREDLLQEWSDENGILKPSDVHFGSYTYVWWKCKNGHPSWKVQVKNRTHGSKCPYCTHQRTLVGTNDLQTLFPNLIKEWDFEKNILKPNEIMPQSNKKAWWKCEKCGNEWQAIIQSRVNGNGCPICGRKKAEIAQQENRLKKNGSLDIVRPDLIKEWNFEKNSILPSQLTEHSNKKVWWICKKGHEWFASVNRRSTGVGCPTCNKEKGTSFAEQTICYYLSMVTEVQNRYVIDGYEIDIYLPLFNIGIEYDGLYFHSSKKAIDKENEKNIYLKTKGIILLRVKETNDRNLENTENVLYHHYDRNFNNMDELINLILKRLSLPSVNVNHKRDSIKIYECYIQKEKENSIASKKPQLLEEWNYDKNGKLNPHYFRHSSNHKVWWKCKKCGNEWQAPIYSRVNGNGCPYCANKKLLKSFNDFKTLNPNLMEEWNYDKNFNLDPTSILGCPKIKVWWKCKKCGNEWQATIDKRSQGRGCPICKNELGRKKSLATIVSKKGSIAQLTDLMLDWDNEKNIDLNPGELTFGSGKRAFWKCHLCGYEWSAIIKNRTSGHGCPKCARKK